MEKIIWSKTPDVFLLKKKGGEGGVFGPYDCVSCRVSNCSCEMSRLVRCQLQSKGEVPVPPELRLPPEWCCSGACGRAPMVIATQGGFALGQMG